MHEGLSLSLENAATLKMKRRRFLGLGLTTAATFLLTGCEKVDPNCGSATCDTMPLLDVSRTFRSEIEKSVAVFRRIFPPQSQSFQVILQKSNGEATGGYAEGISPTDNKVRVFLPHANNQTLQVGKVITVHEATHIFSSVNHAQPIDYVEGELKTRITNNKFTNSELRFLTESSYADSDFEKGLGHPGDNYDELMASTMTILRNHPQDFIDSLQDTSRETRMRIATTGLVVMDALVKFSVIPVDYNSLGFNPKLISFLKREGKKAA